MKKAYVEITNRCNLSCAFCALFGPEPVFHNSLDDLDLVIEFLILLRFL